MESTTPSSPSPAPPFTAILDEETRNRLIESIPRVGDIDSCKENIQPYRKGRSMSALNTLLGNSAEREAALQEGHEQFREQLKHIDEQDDPLQTYINYIEWTIQMYPEGPKGKSNLLWLLEDATTQFSDDARYKADPRYLKTWLEYAKHSEYKKNVYLHLMENDIGQGLALFYEDYAAYYERLEKVDEAIQVFELGIFKEAVPLKRLKENYDRFKARMQERQRRGLLQKQQMEAKRQMESLKSTGQRTMLGQKFDSTSRVSVSANVHANIEARFGGLGALGSSSSGLPSRSFGNSAYNSTGSTMSSPSESFSVFTESTSAQPSSSLLASRSSITPAAARSSSPSSASHSLHSGTISSAFRRENQRPTEKFAGATIRQSSLPTPPAIVEKFQVYQDPSDDTAPSSHAALERGMSSSSMLSISMGDGSDLTQSKQRRLPALDPTQKKKRRKDREAQQQKSTIVPEFLVTRFMQRRHLYFQSNDTKGGIEYIPIPQHHDHNVSFEQLRATARKEYHSQEQRVSRKGKGKATGQNQMEETDGLSRYHHQELESTNTAPEYTTETLAAMQSIQSLFKPEEHYTKEEEDLTWTSPYQRFEPVYRPPVNENE
ncbi:hypothetical protein MAM1_0199c07834 [Mucor ambiguus]|uniref:BUB1 N-terminal domain-containing protein n=1 Tax=Mucor ambiguus TaxID=91626 RepID=A0A0C9LWD3_9FUNG|nr:hypothetical protein MAM1_0199c07834 [Mucor ambiguus]